MWRTDTQTYTCKFIFCPCIALDRQQSRPQQDVEFTLLPKQATKLNWTYTATVDLVADLLPVSATVDFQQSRLCWIQLCRRCVPCLKKQSEKPCLQSRLRYHYHTSPTRLRTRTVRFVVTGTTWLPYNTNKLTRGLRLVRSPLRTCNKNPLNGRVKCREYEKCGFWPISRFISKTIQDRVQDRASYCKTPLETHVRSTNDLWVTP